MVKETVKTQPMRYAKGSIEDFDKEIEELEQQRASENKQQEAIEKDEAETESLNAEEKTFKKRYGDLRRHTQQLQEQHTNDIRKLQEQIDSLTRKQVKLPKSDEELEEWTEKYPDVAKIVETIATKKALEAREDVEKRLKYVDEMQTQVQLQKAEAELEKLHPDFAEIRADDAFHQWASEQPKWIQSALYENDNDPRAAAKAIDLYKLETKQTKPKTNTKDAAKSIKRTSRAEEPKTQDRNVWSESRVKNLTAKEWDRYEEAISESVANGTFVYDLTGAAR